MSEGQKTRSSNPPSGAEPSQRTPATIVVADDDRVSREMLATALRGFGHTVETVEDGQQAVERVARGGVDLVLLDIMMPRLTGLEACRLLKGMTTEGFIPVILVTVKTDSASRVEGLRIGADDYVCKPFDEKELGARVESMLRIKRLNDHVIQARAKLEQLSVHDSLTGIYNYRYLHTRLGEEFKRAERYHDPLACLVIDIDRLKTVNELAGRNAGDSVIRAVAQVIRRTVREVDVIARFGGDEFLVVLPSTHFAGSVTVAERIWNDSAATALAAEFSHAGSVSLSVGIALYPSRDVRTKDALLRCADVALHQAKRDGGNRICVFQQQGYLYTPVMGPNVLRSRSDRASQRDRGSKPDDGRGSIAEVRVDRPAKAGRGTE
jgi:two-component system, cell cycle response regulator